MNRFNRIGASILLLGGLLGSGIVLYFLVIAPQEFINPILSYLNAVAQVMTNTAHYNRISFAVGMGGIIWLCLGFLLWLELRTPSKTTVRISNMANEKVDIDQHLVTQRLTISLHRLADIDRVEPVVRARGNRIDVRLNLRVNLAANLPLKTREVQAVTRELLEQQMGLSAGKISVMLLPGKPLPEAAPATSRQGTKVA